MDFVAIWKACSIVVTGAFGILGLVKNFKNKKTDKITGWGYVSLAGILISTALGTAAQIRESLDDAAKALKIALTSQATLEDIHRTLVRIDSPSIVLDFSADCNQRTYAPACNSLKTSRRDFFDTRNWKQVFNSRDDSLFYGVSIYAKQGDIEGINNGERIPSNIKYVQGGDDIRNDRESFVGYDKSDNSLHIYIVDKSPFAARNDETILSFPDFLGKFAVVSGTEGVRGNFSPRRLIIRMKDGEHVGCRTFKKINSPVEDGGEDECVLSKDD